MAELALLGVAFKVLLERLSSPELIKSFRGRKHGKRLLKKLRLKLLGLNKVLNDAEDKQITERVVREWLDKLKGTVYDAEDLVDEIATAALRRKVELNYQRPNMLQYLISCFTKLFDDEIESKLERMMEELEEFTKDKDVLGLREVVGPYWSPTRLQTTSLVDESCVYGRENDKEEIMKLMLSDSESTQKVDVIPIVGMGGVGKTTLAQLLYNDGRVVAHFDKKAWICVSEVFDVLSISRTIIEAVTRHASDAKDLNLLQLKLKESLSGKRFLIVLDDVWNENYRNWDVLKAPFIFGAHGSKIIVTTRNENVASIMQTVPIHGLQELAEEDCWKLFSGLAFEKVNCSAHPDLEQIGKKIVEKCKGLPLAVKTLGGLLRSQQNFEYWNNILKSAIWELPKDKSDILPALRLSYHYLPSHLKRCFAYCSILVKDYEFNMQELVSIWMAEGLLEKHKNNNTIEEEGCEWFHELLSRSFFQRSKANDSLYVMHDLIHDLAQYMMGDFCYSIEDVNVPYDIAEKVRHFSFVRCGYHGFKQLKEITKAKYLRTFLPLKRRGAHNFLSKKVMDDILLRLPRLRVLSLSAYQIGELPHSIGDLMHLRFLDLSGTDIRELPDSVCKLYNLETLLLVKCSNVAMLPADLPKLISLRRLDLSGTKLKEMPMHISKLKDLQQLTVFVVGKSKGTGINELGEFSCLRRTISISGLQNVKNGNNALEAKMSKKEHLEEIELKWDSPVEDSRDVLEKLEPHKKLKHLGIFNYGGTSFPTWLGDQSFFKMVSLHLKECENCLSLPPLGQIPSLKKLTIESMSGITSLGSEFYGESSSLSIPFQSLETLCFVDMAELVDWSTSDAVEFSRLQKLSVLKCPKLIGDLPNKVPSLVELQIEKCPRLAASLPRTTSIRKLTLVECPRLTASIPRTTSLRQLVLKECQGMQLEWHGLSSIEKLEISGYSSLREFPSETVTLRNLKKLRVNNCPSLYVPLSEGMSLCNMFLEKLTLDTCESLKSFPLGLFPNLISLRIEDCTNFETLLIPERVGLQNPLLLESLTISHCHNMLSFPLGGLPAPNLAELSVQHCKKLKALPEQMHTLLPSLQILGLDNCPKIESFPDGGLPSKLDSLTIRSCEKLVGGRRDWGLQTLPSLTTFILREHYDVLESFPEEGLLGSTLKFLDIADVPNLKSLNGRGLQLLGSLKTLAIVGCHQLQSLPEERLPTSLFQLDIRDSPLLKPRCRREKGEDWHKIAHIKCVEIDGDLISE